MTRHILLPIAILGLAACGAGPDTEAPSAELDQVDTPVSEASESPGMMPPAPAFTEDGAVITANVGDQISVLLDLQDNAPSSMTWSPIDSVYPSIVTHDRTWQTLEGRLRYSEVVLTAAEAGTATVTFHVFESGTRTDWPERTVTFEISD